MPLKGSGKSTSSSGTQAKDLDSKAGAFAQEVSELLAATLPGEHAVAIEQKPPAYVLRTSSDGGRSIGDIPLRIDGQDRACAFFFVRMSLRPDRTGRHLAVANSALWLRGPDRRPIVRLEFVEDARRFPVCHWQFHGENFELDRVLQTARPDSKAARNLSALHYPVGGVRMRPGIEDFLQFLIQECGFESVPGWRKPVEASRADWRIRQTKAMVRDAPRAAAKSLAEHLGVRVLRLARLSEGTDDLHKGLTRW